MKSLKNKRKNEAKDAVIFLETSDDGLMNGGPCWKPGGPTCGPCPCSGVNLDPCINCSNGCGTGGHSGGGKCR